MPTGSRIKKTLTPFYAVAGASDLAAQKLRLRLAALRGEPTALQHRVRDRADALRHDLQVLPDKAAETYDDLTERGRNVVSRIRHQEPTTASRGKRATRSTARKSTGSTARKQATRSTAR
jgi:heparin binding hemagglutinin HbhA